MIKPKEASACVIRESPPAWGARALETLRALSTPARAIPLCLVTLMMLLAEGIITENPRAVGLDLLLAISFVLIGPASWRALLGAPLRTGAEPRLLGMLAYLTCACVTVGLVGYALPFWLDVRTYVTDPYGIGMMAALFAVGGWGLGRDIEMELGLLEERARREGLALEAEHAQLLALKSQLDPHFLFNTLNAIAEWCQEDPAVAEAATLRLADLMRAVLEGVESARWPLARELELAESLLAMYALRDRERFRLEMRVPDPLPALDVPPLLLLPLFENAVRHGPAKGHVGAVEVSVAHGRDAVVIEVENPGAFTGRRAGGHGLPTLERRLALTYGDAARFRIEAKGENTLCTIQIPYSERVDA